MIGRYAATGASVTGVGGGLLWLSLDGSARTGAATGAGAAFAVQVVAFWLLVRFRSRIRPFMWAWVGGMALRLMALAALSALVMARGESFPPTPTLLTFIGALFGLLALEFVHLGTGRPGSAEPAEKDLSLRSRALGPIRERHDGR